MPVQTEKKPKRPVFEIEVREHAARRWFELNVPGRKPVKSCDLDTLVSLARTGYGADTRLVDYAKQSRPWFDRGSTLYMSRNSFLCGELPF